MITIQNISGGILTLGFIGKNGAVIPPLGIIQISEEDFDNPSMAQLISTKISILNYGDEPYEYLRKSEGCSVLPYDNTESELEADTVQDAIDELASGVPSSIVTFNPTGTSLESTNVQDALMELNEAESIKYDNEISELESENVQDAIDELSEAENIKYVPTGTGIDKTNVQEAITEQSYYYKPVCSSVALIKTHQRDNLYTTFWSQVRKTVGMPMMEQCLQFFYIKVITTVENVVIPAVRYPSTVALVDAIFAVAEHTGEIFDENIQLYFMEKESTKEPFTQIKVCRNSLFSGMIGRHKGKRQRQGLHAKFEANIYYNEGTLMGGTFATKCLQYFYSITPPTNDNRIIWNANRKSNSYSLPKEGSEFRIDNRTAYNTVTNTYEQPVSAIFIVGHPHYLVAENFGKSLELTSLTGTKDYMKFLKDNIVAVFPLTSGDLRVFAIYPVGFDVFFTDYVDTTLNTMVCIMRFKSERRCRYVPLTKMADDGITRSMWRLPQVFNPSRLSTCNLDGSMIPSKFEFTIFNHATATFSKKQNVAVVRRRLPNAPLMICPAFNSR